MAEMERLVRNTQDKRDFQREETGLLCGGLVSLQAGNVTPLWEKWTCHQSICSVAASYLFQKGWRGKIAKFFF